MAASVVFNYYALKRCKILSKYSISRWILRRLWFDSQMELGLAVPPLGLALKQQRSSMPLVCASSFSIDPRSYDFLMLPVTPTLLDVTILPLIQ